MVQFCVCVFPSRPCTAFIRGTLIIVWPHVSLIVWERKLKQEKGTERYTSIRPPATSPVICAMAVQPCHPLCGQWKTKLDAHSSATQTPSILEQWFGENVNKQRSFIITTLLISIQVICTNIRRRSGDTGRGIWEHRRVYNCKCQRLIFAALCAQGCFRRSYENVLCIIHQHTFYA